MKTKGELLSLLFQECLVGGDEFQVGGRGDVVVALKDGQVLLRELASGLVKLFAHVDTLCLY